MADNTITLGQAINGGGRWGYDPVPINGQSVSARRIPVGHLNEEQRRMLRNTLEGHGVRHMVQENIPPTFIRRATSLGGQECLYVLGDQNIKAFSDIALKLENLKTPLFSNRLEAFTRAHGGWERTLYRGEDAPDPVLRKPLPPNMDESMAGRIVEGLREQGLDAKYHNYSHSLGGPYIRVRGQDSINHLRAMQEGRVPWGTMRPGADAPHARTAGAAADAAGGAAKGPGLFRRFMGGLGRNAPAFLTPVVATGMLATGFTPGEVAAAVTPGVEAAQATAEGDYLRAAEAAGNDLGPGFGTVMVAIGEQKAGEVAALLQHVPPHMDYHGQTFATADLLLTQEGLEHVLAHTPDSEARNVKEAARVFDRIDSLHDGAFPAAMAGTPLPDSPVDLMRAEVEEAMTAARKVNITPEPNAPDVAQRAAIAPTG